jgi:hypothetical protein
VRTFFTGIEAVQGGVWDADAVANALLGAEPRLF